MCIELNLGGLSWVLARSKSFLGGGGKVILGRGIVYVNYWEGILL